MDFHPSPSTCQVKPLFISLCFRLACCLLFSSSFSFLERACQSQFLLLFFPGVLSTYPLLPLLTARGLSFFTNMLLLPTPIRVFLGLFLFTSRQLKRKQLMICMRCSHPPIWFHLHGKHSHDRTSSPVPKGPQSIHLPVDLSAMAHDSR